MAAEAPVLIFTAGQPWTCWSQRRERRSGWFLVVKIDRKKKPSKSKSTYIQVCVLFRDLKDLQDLQGRWYVPVIVTHLQCKDP